METPQRPDEKMLLLETPQRLEEKAKTRTRARASDAVDGNKLEEFVVRDSLSVS